MKEFIIDMVKRGYIYIMVLCQDLVQNKMRSSASYAAGREHTLSYIFSKLLGDI